MEQRCTELGANCVCSEPFNTLTYTPVGSSWYNPADSTVKECTSDSFSDPVYKGASVMRNDNDLSGSNALSILNALPAGNKVNYVLRAADGHLGGWMAGHDMKSFGGDGRFVKRMAVRWYKYYSPNYAFDSQDDLGCDQGLKWSEWSAGHRVTLSYYTPSFSTYNYLTFSPSSDCCFPFVSYPGNKAAFRGKWWRFEAVFTNRNGPAYNMQVYVKDVTDNGPETKVIDLQQYGLPGSPSISPPIQGLTPGEQQTLFLINNYRQGSSCPGFSAISHYMLAGWDTDQGQRIGAAYEVEGGGSTPDTTPPSTPTLNSPTVISSSQINFQWSPSTDAESGISGYNIYRCSGSSACTPTLLSNVGNVNSYSNTGLTPNTIYRYQVSAVNGVNLESTKSSIQTATTLPPTFDFSLSNGGSKTITQGQSISNTITTTLSSGTSQSVSFSSSGFPSGATSSFSPVSCLPTCTTTITINTINSTPTGNYTINVNGIGGTLTRATNFRLTVNPIITNSCFWDFFPRDIPDGKVTLGDVLVVVGDFGKTSASPGFNPRMDFNNNNQIDLFDVLSVVANFGKC